MDYSDDSYSTPKLASNREDQIVLLEMESIRKLIQRKAAAAVLKLENDRTLRDTFCYRLREMCLLQTGSRDKGIELTHLCMNELSLGSGATNSVKAFRRIIQLIPCGETLFESSDDTFATYQIMRPSKPSKKALCPAFGGVAAENLIGWLEGVNAEKFSNGLAEHKDPYFFIKDWKKLDHSVAWLKNSDGTFQMISNEKRQQMNPHEQVYLEMVVLKRDQANLH